MVGDSGHDHQSLHFQSTVVMGVVTVRVRGGESLCYTGSFTKFTESNYYARFM